MTEQADVVVIGSGVAGALCAHALARRGVKVLVLEAGPRMQRAQIVESIMSTPDLDLAAGYPNPSWAPRPDWSGGRDSGYIRQAGPDIVRLAYLRLVGGTTWHWSGSCDRLLPADFRLRSTYGVGVNWPISYDDLEPRYLEAERELGVAGGEGAGGDSVRSAPFPLPQVPPSYGDKVIGERLRGLGIPLRPRPAARNTQPFDGRPVCEGFSLCTPICPIGAQYGAIVHVEKAERLGARVLAESRVDRLRADAQGRIVEAQFGRPDGSSDTAAGRIFILAANGVESPRLLLASADDTFPRGLANSSDQVGRNFMDHFGSQISLDTSVRLYPNRAPVFTSYTGTLRDGAFRASASAAMIHPSNQINVFDVTAELLKSDILPPALDAQIRDRVTRRAAFSVFVEQLPRPDNRITIDWNERDTAGQPRIRLAYTSDEYTKAGMQRAVELVGRLGPLLGASKITVSEPNSYNHPMGALRMGHDAKTAVVDAFGRAHDHPNLFVAGAAVFPSSGAASPTLTIAALSLRTAEAVIRQMG